MGRREARGENREAGGENREAGSGKNQKSETKSSPLETHLLFTLVAIVAWWIFRNDSILLLGLGLGVIGLFIKPLARWIDWGWRKFSEGLGWLMSKVVMGIIYILVLIPVAALARMSRKDPLMLKKADSYWHKRDSWFQKEDLEKMW